jgi:hypothetical protein
MLVLRTQKRDKQLVAFVEKVSDQGHDSPQHPYE